MDIIYDLSKLPKELRKTIENSPKYSRWFSEFPTKLLGIDSNAKTVKGQKKNVLTGILYGIPHTGSGINMCSMAVIAECHLACLVTAGRGAMLKVFMGRLRKTLFLQQYPKEFKILLVKDINKLVTRSNNKNMVPMVRLNGTFDYRWEVFFPEIFKMFPEVQFYDYTKIPNRKTKHIPNYDLTFSYSGVKEYQPYVKQAIANGMRIAVVFKHKDRIPAKFLDMECVNGDDSDIRPYDPHGVVVALYAKGKAINDTSGFVVDNTFMGV